MSSQAGSSRTRHELNNNQLIVTKALNFGSTTVGSSTDLTMTVTGAADGDPVMLGVPNAATQANSSYSAWVSAADTVTVRFVSHTGTINPASGTFKVCVLKAPNYTVTAL
jgi:hypothetical protein